jgi:anti-anti-sigma factor
MVVGLEIDIDAQEGGGQVTIRCRGELDIASAAKLIDAFDRVGAERPDSVLVDLRALSLIDSTGTGCLIHGALAFQRRGAAFHLLAGEAERFLIEKAGLTALLVTDVPDDRQVAS